MPTLKDSLKVLSTVCVVAMVIARCTFTHTRKAMQKLIQKAHNAVISRAILQIENCDALAASV